MTTPTTDTRRWYERLDQHRRNLTAAEASRDRDMDAAHREGLSWRKIGELAGLNHETARAHATTSSPPSPPLEPGPYLQVPAGLLQADDDGSAGVLTAALAALSARLTGFLPPADWGTRAIEEYLAVELAARVPAGHWWGLAVEPDPRTGARAYGVWPD